MHSCMRRLPLISSSTTSHMIMATCELGETTSTTEISRDLSHPPALCSRVVASAKVCLHNGVMPALAVNGAADRTGHSLLFRNALQFSNVLLTSGLDKLIPISHQIEWFHTVLRCNASNSKSLFQLTTKIQTIRIIRAT